MRSHEADDILREMSAACVEIGGTRYVSIGTILHIIRRHSHKTILEWLAENFG